MRDVFETIYEMFCACDEGYKWNKTGLDNFVIRCKVNFLVSSKTCEKIP
jgi:hypothetical protein